MRYLNFNDKQLFAPRKPQEPYVGKPRMPNAPVKDIKALKANSPPPDQVRINLRVQQTIRNKRVQPSMPKMPWDIE